MTDDLKDYCDGNGIRYRVLSPAEKEKILLLISERYIDKDARSGLTMFDRLTIREAVAVNDSDSWRWLFPFFKGKKAVVFKSPDDESYVELSDCGDFFDFYDDYAAVEFYLIDPCGGYICGYNHSHCAFAMGSAADWLEHTEKYRQFYGR